MKHEPKTNFGRPNVLHLTMIKHELNILILGKVIEKNEKVEELPAVINSSAEDEGKNVVLLRNAGFHS